MTRYRTNLHKINNNGLYTLRIARVLLAEYPIGQKQTRKTNALKPLKLKL